MIVKTKPPQAEDANPPKKTLIVVSAPARAVAEIEGRCRFLRTEARRALAAFFLQEMPLARSAYSFRNSGEMDEALPDEPPLSFQEIERYAPNWQHLAPRDPSSRAAIVQLLAQKFPIPPAGAVQLRAALGLDTHELRTAYELQFHQPLDVIYTLPTEEDAPAALRLKGAVFGGTGLPLSGRQGLEAFDQSGDLLNTAAEQAEWVTLCSGDTLFEPGDPGAALYLVISGRMRLSVPESPANNAGDRPANLVEDAGRGEVIGEVEALTGDQRSMRAYAVRDSELVKVPSAVLSKLAQENQQVLWRLNSILATRLKVQLSANRPSATKISTLALLPAAEQCGQNESLSARLRAFVHAVKDELDNQGPTLLMEAERLDTEFGRGMANAKEDNPDTGRMRNWLNAREVYYDHVLYAADASNSVWAQRCRRQADLVLWVGDGTQPPPEIDLQAYAQNGQAHKEFHLALLYPPGAGTPRYTAAWLDAFDVRAFYHVRDGNRADLRRLVRRLTKKALGLVLGGGGARGFAHIGVMRALREAGIEVDLIGGTSMGAILGAAYAQGLDDRELLDLAKEFASPFKLFDPTLPLVSFFSSDKVNHVLQFLFKQGQIEDLWRPFFCVSSNLTRAQTVVHERGSLWKATRASSAIPGIFSPLLYDGELMVDGAVLNNLPVDVMKTFNRGGPVVAVNVFPDVDLVNNYEFGESVSGWRVLFNQANPFSERKTPSIFENLLRVVALNDVNSARAKQHLIDLYIRPEVDAYNILDFQSYEPVIELGYQATVAALEHCAEADATVLDCLPPAARPVQALNRTLLKLERTLGQLEMV